MTLQFSLASSGTANPETVETPCVVVGVYENGLLTSAAARVDTAAHGAQLVLLQELFVGPYFCQQPDPAHPGLPTEPGHRDVALPDPAVTEERRDPAPAR